MLTKIHEQLRGRINLLIVDDDEAVRFLLAEQFTSPLFTVTQAGSLAEARAAIAARPIWHCWIIDVFLANGECGLDLLDARRDFPFAIVISGQASIEAGADAIVRGAWQVIAKKAGVPFLDRVRESGCRAAALAFLAHGKLLDQRPVFALLRDHEFGTPREWAEAACVGERQLRADLRRSLGPGASVRADLLRRATPCACRE